MPFAGWPGEERPGKGFGEAKDEFYYETKH